jgi:hypothetical protein
MAIPVRRGGRSPQLRLAPQVDFTGGLNAVADRFLLLPNESPDLLNVDVSQRGGVQRRRAVQAWGGYQPFGSATTPSRLFEHRDQVNNSSQVVATEGGTGATNMACGIGASWTSVTNTGDDEILDHAQMNGKSWFTCGAAPTQSWATPAGVPDTATTVVPDSHGAYQNDYATAVGDIFPHARYVESHGGFMWAAYTDEATTIYPTRVRFSHPGYADRWAEDDWIEIGDEDGDEIVKIASFRDHLLVFMHRSVHAIFGYSRQNFQVVKVSSSVGAVSDTGVCVNPEGAWFFSPDRGVYYYNGDGEPKWAFEKVYPLMDNGYFDDANLDEVQVASVRSRIWVRVPMADGDHRCFVFDPTSGAWVAYDVDMRANVEFQNSDEEVLHVAATGTSNGLVRLEAAATYDTFNDAETSTEVGVRSYYTTRWIDGGSPFQPKRFKKPEFIVSGVAAHTIQVDVFLDYYDGSARKTLLLNVEGTATPNGLVWDDDDGNPDDNALAQWDERVWAYSSAATQDEIVRGGSIGGAGRAVALKFRGPDNVQWEIRGFTLKFLPKKARS